MGIIHQPDGTIEERLQKVEREYGGVIRRLITYDWSNESISNYLGTDVWTIKRFRKLNETKVIY